MSIPADARARWNADRVMVIDLGDRIVMRPLPEDAAGELVGKYRRGPSTDDPHLLDPCDDEVIDVVVLPDSQGRMWSAAT